jgi:DNA-binding NarL/FixJ family response regulator
MCVQKLIVVREEGLFMGFLGITNQEHKYEIEQLTAKYTKIIERCERDVSELKNLLYKKEEYIQKLKAQIENPEKTEPPHKAGRKPKMSPDDMAEVLRMHEEGFSYSQIAKNLTETSGEYICKSTVANIIKGRKTVQK